MSVYPLTTYLPTDRENRPTGDVLVGRSSQLALFSASSRSFSTATSALISAIIIARILSHFDVGFGWTNLQNSIDEAISTYFEELRRGWGDAPYLIVRVSQIETRILAIKGVVDIQDTRLNDAAENLTLNKFQVPVYGGASA